MTAEVNSNYIQVDGELIHYVNGGQRVGGNDLPIVLVHGLAGDTTWWRNNLEPLCELTEVYALDLPGFGRSRTQRPFSIEAQFDALANWLAAVRVRRAILVGHSLGGYLAALLAARSPALVAKLVLVDPAI